MEIGAGGAEEGNGEVMELTKVTYNGADPKTPEERQKQAIISVLTFQPEYNDHPGYNPDPDKLADAIVAALKEQVAEAQKAAEWKDAADVQGWWWHWDEDEDNAPFIYHVMCSRSSGPDRFFIAFPDSRWCDEIGGKWMKIERPINPPTESEEQHG